MDIQGIVNWMQRETCPGGTIHKWALTQEALPNGVPFMGGFVELFPGATLPLTVDVQAAEAPYNAQLLRSILLAALASHRWTVASGGTTINGIAIPTDDSTLLKLSVERTKAKEDANYAVTWKTAAAWTPLDAPSIIAVADAVHAFVKKCYATEETIAANVSNYATAGAIIAAFDQAMAI